MLLHLQALLHFVSLILHSFPFWDLVPSIFLHKELLLPQESSGATSQLPEEIPKFLSLIHYPLVSVKPSSPQGSLFLQQVNLLLTKLRWETNLPSATSLVPLSTDCLLTASPRIQTWIQVLQDIFCRHLQNRNRESMHFCYSALSGWRQFEI